MDVFVQPLWLAWRWPQFDLVAGLPDGPPRRWIGKVASLAAAFGAETAIDRRDFGGRHRVPSRP